MFWGPLRQINKTTTCVKLQKYLQTSEDWTLTAPLSTFWSLLKWWCLSLLPPVENIVSEDEILIDSK